MTKKKKPARIVGDLNMSTYLAASDETKNYEATGFVTYGGFFGPVEDWTNYFEPAWRERVLGGKPTLDYLHMIDLRDPRWRASKGLPEWEAERRIVEAINVLDSMGSIRPVTSSIPAKPFMDDIAARFKKIKGESHGVRVPDFISFIGYVHGVLENAVHIPGVTKVDFLVEQNGNVTEILRAFHGKVKTSLSKFGRGDLIALMGEFRPGGKELIPLQAADVFCWYLQRHQSGKLHGDWPNARRWNRLIGRIGHKYTWSDDSMQKLGNGLAKQIAAAEAAAATAAVP
jgi:hypothetical protein